MAVPTVATVDPTRCVGSGDCATVAPTAFEVDEDTGLARVLPGGAALRDGVGGEHLDGLIALMVQEIAARAVRPDPEEAPQRDQRTSRGSRWLRFPVVFPGSGGGPTTAGRR